MVGDQGVPCPSGLRPRPRLLGYAPNRGCSGMWCVHFIKVLARGQRLPWNKPSKAPGAHLSWITTILFPLPLLATELVNAGCFSTVSGEFPS